MRRDPLRSMLSLVAVAVPLLAPQTAVGETLRVVGPDDAPLPGAGVEVHVPPASSSPFALVETLRTEGTTDDEGRFDATIPEVKSLVLVLDHPEFLPAIIRCGPQPPDAVQLDPGSVLDGRVVARDDGPPVVSGRACATWTRELPRLRRERRWRRCADLGDEGRFRLRGLPEGPATVTVTAEGFLPERLEIPRTDGPATVELERGYRLSGRVLAAGRDEPVPGAGLEAPGSARAETGAQGRFEIAVPTLPTRLEVSAQGFRSARPRVGRREAREELKIRLDPGQQLRGMVVGEDLAPLERVSLWTEQFQPPTSWTVTEHQLELDEGELRVDLAEPGRYRLRVGSPGFEETSLGEVELVAGTIHELGLVVLGRGAGVRGRVIDETTGEGVSGASLRLIPRGTAILDAVRHGGIASGTTDEHGEFELTGLDAGTYEMRVEHARYALAAEEVRIDEDRMRELGNLPVGPGVAIEGRVVDRSGAPRAGVSVRVFDGAGATLEPITERTTSSTGRFSGLTLDPGRYLVRVHGERLLLAQEVTVPRGRERFELTLTISSVRLRGRVVRHREPVDGGFLTLTSELDPGHRRGTLLVHTGGEVASSTTRHGVPDSYLSARVSADGTFELEDAPAGPASVAFYPSDGPSVERSIQVPDRAEAWVEIDVAGSTLTGRVVDESSGLGVEATIEVLSDGGRVTATTTSGTDGRFSVQDLRKGPAYNLRVTAPGYSSRSIRGIVVDGSTPLSIELAPGNDGTLAIALQRSDGSTASSIMVSLLDRSGRRVRSRLTDAQGAGQFEGLAAGEYFLVWNDPVAGSGSSSALRIRSGEVTRHSEVLPPASTLELRCPAEVCAGAMPDALAVYTVDGVEIGDYLSGMATQMRFSATGRLRLGKISPGRYLVRAGIDGGFSDRVVSVEPGGVAVVSLP